MPDSQALDTIVDLLRHQGDAQYGGEAVTQLEHACQCANLAQQQGASPSLITACLLHDIGHLVHDLGDMATIAGIDDHHEYLADRHLRPYFPAAVTEPIRLHVAAKRYLCATDNTYWHQLSPNSQHSLQLQGGAFSPQAAAAFIAQPYAWEAVQLRRWDDQAKVPHLVTPPLATFWQIALSVSS